MKLVSVFVHEVLQNMPTQSNIAWSTDGVSFLLKSFSQLLSRRAKGPAEENAVLFVRNARQ